MTGVCLSELFGGGLTMEHWKLLGLKQVEFLLKLMAM